MQPTSQRDLLLLAAARLGVPARRLRLLARGEERLLREWIERDSSRSVAAARLYAVRAGSKIASYGAELVALTDDGYVRRLLDLRDPPPFLIVRGNLPQDGLTIVGSRRPPEAALDFAYELARRSRRPVVAGLAAGVDAAAHRGALSVGIPTVAYVGHGLGATFPREHASLEGTIAAAGGAVAAERLPGEAALSWALIRRDRLQAAHGGATVLVASEIGGGAMHTVSYAGELHRPRFALVPPEGEQGDVRWGGNLRALAEGALALPFDPDEALKIVER